MIYMWLWVNKKNKKIQIGVIFGWRLSLYTVFPTGRFPTQCVEFTTENTVTCSTYI